MILPLNQRSARDSELSQNQLKLRRYRLAFNDSSMEIGGIEHS